MPWWRGLRHDRVRSAMMAMLPTIITNIPARLDRLPWSRFHVLVIIGLGITWILDGLEVTIVGSIGPALQNPLSLGMSVRDVGMAASFYLAGAVGGALLFGWLTDRVGRKRIFSLTLGLYILAVLATACAWDRWSFVSFRFLTGMAIGGEYAAINSAIDELVPARLRGRIDLMVNGSFWLGAAAGAGLSMLMMGGPALGTFGLAHGWRFGFLVGGILGFGVLILRHWVPESPRWLLTHGHHAEAETVMYDIERRCTDGHPAELPHVTETLTVHPRRVFGFAMINRAMMGQYKVRSALALLMMVAQAFLYNAVFFTYGQVLTVDESVSPDNVGRYILPLAIGNLIGPLLLGGLFDTIGRRRMIFLTYGISGLLMIAVAGLFAGGHLTATTQTIGWVAIFFFASPAASAAYLTASEIFPLETRAMAISLFYVLGTLIGGVGAPYLFGVLIDMGGRLPLAYGYLGAAALMIAAGLMALKFGVDAEGKSLESIAAPLSGDA
jgi:MFS family permease